MVLQVLGLLVALDGYGMSVMADLTVATGRVGALRHECRTEEKNEGNEGKQRRKQFPGNWVHN